MGQSGCRLCSWVGSRCAAQATPIGWSGWGLDLVQTLTIYIVYNVMLINRMFNVMLGACRESSAANTAALIQCEKHSSVIKRIQCVIKRLIKHFHSQYI